MPSLPIPNSAHLAKRQLYGYSNNYGYNNRWYNWGRWVTLGAVILVAFFLFMSISCLNARRRRKRGAQPIYGSGWLAPNHGPVNYYPQTETQQPYYPSQAAPPYAPETNNAGGYYGNTTNNAGGYSNDYYGGQQNGIELQQPSNAYQPPPVRGGETGGYAPPPGPPPGKLQRDIVR